MTLTHQNRSRNDPLRWYLLLWIGLVSLWGLFEVSRSTISAAWNACSTGSELSGICAQLKQHLGPQGQPDIASLPPALLTALLLQGILIFFLFLLAFSVLLWFGLSGKEKQRWTWLTLALQGAIPCVMGLLVPTLGITVPASLLLVLILETCAVFQEVRAVLIFSTCVLLCFLLASVLAWREEAAFRESSLTAIVMLALLVGSLLFVGGFFVLYTRLARIHSALATAYARLEAANTHIEELTLAMERQRMARELHDTLAQGLAGIILQLGVAHARVKSHEYTGVEAVLEQTLASARETLANARGAIENLRVPSPSAADLVGTIQEEARRFTLLTGLPCAAECTLLSQVPERQAQQIPGVIREALANVARHAQACRAWVHTCRDEHKLCLEIGDDGIGFDPSQVGNQPGHYGLLGLRERAHLAGSQIAIMSAPGQGTRIQLSWPVE